ncbi:bifunctional diaminohydroxyphosphoribosylaminopyrimidine deaminase/5-amino-6-(5-phosphoribosylamino)uracil reductase RibD [Fervidobacterium sp.]
MANHKFPSDEYFMKIAINLAKKGLGLVNPNPPVGAVIVKDGKIIGKGYHTRYGSLHAEREALLDAVRNGYSTEEATMYVTLEPCDHYGKTPPCTEAIIQSGIKRVVIAMYDPNPISGNGVTKLKNNGIEVDVGVLESDAKELTKFFIKRITKTLPFVTLKYASTLDGMISDYEDNSKWITTELRNEVHKLRKIHSAIIVGANTILKDNPLLNVRLNKKKQLKNPAVVILDKSGKTLDNLELNVFKEEFKRKVIVFTEKTPHQVLPAHISVENESTPESILRILSEKGFDSVLIEGGASVYSQFLEFADEIYGFYSLKVFGRGKNIFYELKKNIAKSDIDFSITKTQVSINKKELMVVMRRCSQE